MSEQPRETRAPITLKIKFKSGTVDDFIERYSVDVSHGGIFIRTKQPLAIGTPLNFEFQLQDASPIITGDGTVVWAREHDPQKGGSAPGMGVRFDRLPQPSQGVLDKILAEKARRGERIEESRYEMGMQDQGAVAASTEPPAEGVPAAQEAARVVPPVEEEAKTPLPSPVPAFLAADGQAVSAGAEAAFLAADGSGGSAGALPTSESKLALIETAPLEDAAASAIAAAERSTASPGPLAASTTADVASPNDATAASPVRETGDHAVNAAGQASLLATDAASILGEVSLPSRAPVLATDGPAPVATASAASAPVAREPSRIEPPKLASVDDNKAAPIEQPRAADKGFPWLAAAVALVVLGGGAWLLAPIVFPEDAPPPAVVSPTASAPAVVPPPAAPAPADPTAAVAAPAPGVNPVAAPTPDAH